MIHDACADSVFQRRPDLFQLLDVGGPHSTDDHSPRAEKSIGEFWVGANTLAALVERTGGTTQDLEDSSTELFDLRDPYTNELHCRITFGRELSLAIDGARFLVRVAESVTPSDRLALEYMPLVSVGCDQKVSEVKGMFHHTQYGFLGSLTSSDPPQDVEFTTIDMNGSIPDQLHSGVRGCCVLNFCDIFDDAPAGSKSNDCHRSKTSTSYDLPTHLTPSLPGPGAASKTSATDAAASREGKPRHGRRRRNLIANIVWVRSRLRMNAPYYWLAANTTEGKYLDWATAVPQEILRACANSNTAASRRSDMCKLLSFVGNAMEHLDEPENIDAKEALRSWAQNYKGGKFYDEFRFDETAGELFPIFFVDKVCPKDHVLWQDYT
eukprot:GSA25T00009646001.1